MSQASVTLPTASAPARPSTPTWRRMLRRLRRSPVGMIGFVIVIAVLFASVAAPVLMPHDPTQLQLGKRLRPPAWDAEGDWAYPLGTDQLGRDVWSRVLIGSQISVAVGIIAVLISTVVGVLVGLVAGFYGGQIDTWLSRITDTLLSVPFVLLALALVGALGPGLFNLIVVLSFTGWVTYARVVRGEVLSLKEREYAVAARVIGQRDWIIALKHILPNVAATVIVLTTLNIATTIIAESSLSFLGLGVQPPTVTWGGMLAEGREHVATSWWLATFPGLAITIAVLGIIFVGDWLRDVLDPRLKE